MWPRHSRSVQENWVIDRFHRQVEGYRRALEATLALATVPTEDGTLASPLLPGFPLPVRRIFALPAALIAQPFTLAAE